MKTTEYPHASQLIAAYWRWADKQRADRGKAPVKDYLETVYKAVYQAGLRGVCSEGKPQASVCAAPTGTGKSSAAFCFIAALVEVDPDASVLFTTETVKQAEASYQELVKLLGRDQVAVWTNNHDLDTEDKSGLDYIPPMESWHRRTDLAERKVAICTHALLKGANADDAKLFNGNTRRLSFIDERPTDVHLYDISTGDIANARDVVAKYLKESGLRQIAISELFDLQATLEEVWRTETDKDERYDTVPAVGCSWFETADAYSVLNSVSRFDPAGVARNVFGFARSMSRGFAFSSRFRPETDEEATLEDKGVAGAEFCGYELKLPLWNGCVILDATASLDNWSLIRPDRETIKVPPLDFSKLDITYLHNEVQPKMMITEVVKNKKFAVPYAEHIKRTIFALADEGEQVLAIVHKGMLEGNYQLDDDTDETPFIHPETGKRVRVKFLNWGNGIGSNSFQDCTAVFQFSSFFNPASVHARNKLKDELATKDSLAPFQKRANNKKSGPYFELKEGHYRRHTVQMAMRGKARDVSMEGAAGAMRLILIQENLDRFLRNKEVMFGQAPMTLPAPKATPKQGKPSGVKALLTLLYSTEANAITIKEIKAETGVDWGKHGKRYQEEGNAVARAMANRGWRFEPGTKDRKKLGRLVRD